MKVNQRKARPKQTYIAYVKNTTLEFNTSFINQLRQLMRLVKVSPKIIKKFSPSDKPIELSEEECLHLFDKLNKLTRVRKNDIIFKKFVTMLAQGYAFDIKGMTIIRNI